MTRLEKTLAIDEDGNITATKNSEVYGTTKYSVGINPIHTYPLGNYTFEVIFERYLEESTDYTFFGYIIYDDGTSTPCMGTYSISNGVLTSFSAISYNTIFNLNEGGTVEEKAIATKP